MPPVRLPILLTLAISPLACIAQSTTSVSTLLDQLRSTQKVGDVALTPDGSTVAMELAGNLTIAAVSDPGHGHIVPVCKDDTGRISALSWSPDGSRLAILAECKDFPEILLADPHSAGKPRRLATLHGFGKSLSWAPDGKSLCCTQTGQADPRELWPPRSPGPASSASRGWKCSVSPQSTPTPAS
jgi:Tol biopolymer transport system component